MKKNKGFGILEIVISLAVLMFIFSFVFYFISSINKNISSVSNKPIINNSYNYSDLYCDISEDLNIYSYIDLSDFISTSTPITALSIFNNNLIITTNSASTTESDIFIFSIIDEGGDISLNLLENINTGPGINDAIIQNNRLFTLNTSVNSHIQVFKINTGNTLSLIKEIKIDNFSLSHSLPKKIYLYNKNILLGTEKNNYDGELLVLPLDDDNLPLKPIKSIEINGQVNDIYENQDNIYVANASDIELYVLDKYFNIINSYDAPLSLGNGKSVVYKNPNIYLGRTISSFELFILSNINNVIKFISKYKTNGSIDFIQEIRNGFLFIVNSDDKKLQFYSKKIQNIKNINLQGRVDAFTCFNKNILFATLLNNKTTIIWLK